MSMPNKERDALIKNLSTFNQRLNQLSLLAVSSIEWDLPPTCDVQYLERELFCNSKVIFFVADNSLVCLSGFGSSRPNLYGVPLRRIITAKNGFTAELDNENSLICYDNTLRLNSKNTAIDYALRLSQLDRVIELNTNAQKTPFIIKATKENELSVRNAYAGVDNNEDFIAVTDDFRDDALAVLKSDVPFTGLQIRTLQQSIIDEYLNMRGISTANTNKPERLITSEVAASNGGLKVYQAAYLAPRQAVCDELNRRFGRYLDRPAAVRFRKDMIDYMIPKGGES